jgi:glycosyltransferase involved in cell wall biosynthesis
LTRDKGIPELIEAFDTILEQQTDAHVLLVGWFDVSEDALAEEWRSRITYHLRIPLHRIRSRHSAILPGHGCDGITNLARRISKCRVGSGSDRIPVITTECTGSGDSVVPEVTGLLIPPGYPEAISEAVLKLLGDPERRRRMGEAARNWVSLHFSDERVLRLAISFCKSLLKPKPPSKSPGIRAPNFFRRRATVWLVPKEVDSLEGD